MLGNSENFKIVLINNILHLFYMEVSEEEEVEVEVEEDHKNEIQDKIIAIHYSFILFIKII